MSSVFNPSQLVNIESENGAETSQTFVNCAICQDVIAKNNNSYVDLCLHQYCFDCLKKWCEVKAECPLCKQKIEKIIHSVESPQTYKEFIPGPKKPSLIDSIDQSMQILHRSRAFETYVHRRRIQVISTGSRPRLELSALDSFDLDDSDLFHTSESSDTSSDSEDVIIISSDSEYEDANSGAFEAIDITGDIPTSS